MGWLHGCMVAAQQRRQYDAFFVCACVCVVLCAGRTLEIIEIDDVDDDEADTQVCARFGARCQSVSPDLVCVCVCVFSLLTCPCPCRRSSLIVVARVARSFMRHPSRRRFPFRNPTQNCLFIDRIAFISFSGTFTHAGLTVCQTIVQ